MYNFKMVLTVSQCFMSFSDKTIFLLISVFDFFQTLSIFITFLFPVLLSPLSDKRALKIS